MQAGAFSDRAKAEQIRQMLNSKGLSYNPAVELIVATATNTGVLGTGTILLFSAQKYPSSHSQNCTNSKDPRLTRFGPGFT